MALCAACGRRPGSPVSVPQSVQDGHLGMTLSYDDSGNRPLKLAYFDTSSGFWTIEEVSPDGSVPGTSPLEARNRGAVTSGKTAWKVTLSSEGQDWNDSLFKYNFYQDPVLR